MEVGEENKTVSEQKIPLTPDELKELDMVERQRLRTRSQRQLAALFKDPELKKTLKEEVLEGARIIRTAPLPSVRTRLFKELQQKAVAVREVRMALFFPRCSEVPKNFLTVARSTRDDHGDLYKKYVDWGVEHNYDFLIKWGAGESNIFRSGIVFSVKRVDGPIIFFDKLDEKINVSQIKRMGYVVLNEEFEMQ